MAQKTDIELKTQTDAGIKVNGNREITPPIHNSIVTNMIDSKVNNGAGNVLTALLGHTTELTPTDNKHLSPKKYVDDQDATNLAIALAYTDSEIAANAYDDTPVFYKDGSRQMTGDLDLNFNDIVNPSSIIYAGNTAIDFGTYTYKDSSAVNSFNWNLRRLYDSAGNLLFDFTTSFFGTTSGTVLEGSNDALYAKLAGAQTITGTKTFSVATEFLNVKVKDFSAGTWKSALISDSVTNFLEVGKDFSRVRVNTQLIIEHALSNIQISRSSLAGTVLRYTASSATASTSNYIGEYFYTKNNAGTETQATGILNRLNDTTTGTESGEMVFYVRQAGAFSVRFTLSGTAATFAVPVGFPSYTVATLPSATASRMIYVSDESGGAIPAFSDGTNWRRVTDRAIIS